MISLGVKNRINVNSYPHKVDDFQSATKLCDYFGFELNKAKVKNQTTLSAGEALRMFLLSCGGTYLPFYPVQDFQIREQVNVIITGDQPTGWSHFAGNAIFNGDADKISNDILNFFDSNDIGKELAEEFLSTFDVLGIDKNHPAMLAITCDRSAIIAAGIAQIIGFKVVIYASNAQPIHWLGFVQSRARDSSNTVIH